MSLTEYQKKRDFRKTPEPRGKRAREASGRRFVVQKHAASRLHYDFRLELDGVLKSWAVPKGPSLDPNVKSLAVHVEDHPLEYGSFEGIIPRQEYGGGTVLLWDHGLWDPAEDAARGYRRGKLKFQLHGEKLRGGWRLVRMHGEASEEGRNWLLMKLDDAEARASEEFDILQEQPLSLLSGRGLEEIAAAGDRIWSTNPARKKGGKKSAAASRSRAKKASPPGPSPPAGEVSALPNARSAPLPEDFRPQLATPASEPPEGEGWLHEIKFDGYRLLAIVNEGQVRLLTRNGNDWTDRFRSVAEEVKRLPLRQAVLDGEVVALLPDGTQSFQKLQNWLKRGADERLVYYLFDIPFCDGWDLCRTPLERRKEMLAKIVLDHNPDNSGTVRYSDHIRGQGGVVLENSCRLALEGIISKRSGSRYEPRRAPSWRKVKCLKRQEFVIGGYTRPGGSRQGFGSLLLGYYEKDRLIYCGRVGTGFTHDSLQQLTRQLKELQTASPPFAKYPREVRRNLEGWVEPELVAEVEFTDWTAEGHLRHPSFQGLREDKPPREVGREEGSASRVHHQSNGKSAMRGTRASRQNAHAPDEVAGVHLTNPDRVLYPEQQLTKRDLAQFYADVADWILPHVTHRPLTIVRCPRGREETCFFQKHFDETAPAAIGKVMIQEKSKKQPYIVIRDLPGLISLVQLGVLEIHPWGSRVDRLEFPDRLVFDLDPGEGAGLAELVRAARDVREHLEELGLVSFVRTSGGKGLHVVVPLVRRRTWDDARQFARDVATRLTAEHPERYVATMNKQKRKGRVFIDYLRNGRGASSVATFSTRAGVGAPVATPLHWDELTPRLSPQQFTVSSLRERLAGLRRDPWEGFFSLRQSLTRKMMASGPGK